MLFSIQAVHGCCVLATAAHLLTWQQVALLVYNELGLAVAPAQRVEGVRRRHFLRRTSQPCTCAVGNAGIEKWNAELVARLPFWASWRWCTHLLPILLRHLPVAQPVRGEGMFHLLACEVHACNTRMCVQPGRRRGGETV